MLLQGVDVAIAGRTVLAGIDWSLDRGTHWGVVGPNGSGKSTLLGLVAGTQWPAPGAGARIYDFGSGRLRDAVEARQRVALVGHELQNRYARFGWNFTASDVVLSGVFRTDVPRRRASAAERAQALALLERLGLAELASRRFLELSRGEQRRVLIARAMAFEPEILLLDEPAAGLDRDARQRLDELIAAVAATATIVAAAHAHAEIPAAIDRFIDLAAGRIERIGPRPSAAPRDGVEPGPVEHAEESGAIEAERPRAIETACPLVEIENADVWLGGRRVLTALNWRLDPAEHWLVTGANGSGKSTFLRLLHGQVRPALGGTIRWPALGNSRNVWRLRQNMGYVSAELQAAYRYPTRVRDCIASGFDSSIGLIRELTPAERARVAELLERFEIEVLAERYLTTLSYGQLHRVLLARTLARKPRLLLLDEPWEGLDRATSALVIDQLVQTMAEGTQLVCVSHTGGFDLPFTNELCMREDGRVLEASRVREDSRARERGLRRDDGAAEPRESSSSAQ